MKRFVVGFPSWNHLVINDERLLFLQRQYPGGRSRKTSQIELCIFHTPRSRHRRALHVAAIVRISLAGSSREGLFEYGLWFVGFGGSPCLSFPDSDLWRGSIEHSCAGRCSIGPSKGIGCTPRGVSCYLDLQSLNRCRLDPVRPRAGSDALEVKRALPDRFLGLGGSAAVSMLNLRTCMPLEPIDLMMHRARGAGYAVGYFESWNLESLQGVIDAAEQTRSPVIIGFNGEFLSGPDRLARERLAWYGALGRAAAESASVPCGLIFNECPEDDWVRQAVTSGFNLVMPADPEAPLAEYAERVADADRLSLTSMGLPSRPRWASYRAGSRTIRKPEEV